MKKKNTTYSSHPTRASKLAHEAAKKKFPTYDTSLINPKPSKKPYVILGVVIALIVIAVVAIILMLTLNGCASRLGPNDSVQIDVKEGATTTDIAKQLEKNNVTSASSFKDAVDSMNADGKLQTGSYTVYGGKSDKEYVQIFLNGDYASSNKVVVTEGMTIKKIAEATQKASSGRIQASEFIDKTKNASKYANNFSFLSEVGSNSLEGYLFPKSYPVSSDTTCDDLINKMLQEFDNETKNLDMSYPKSIGLSFYDTVKLASIVEKESATGFQKKVASVFYNRITNNIRLNSDATTAYEVGHDPTPEEVHANTPYSTYTNDGLPPTPICSPGNDALQAVCHPDKTNYFYFYFKEVNGQMKYRFSETYDQHQKAIEEL